MVVGPSLFFWGGAPLQSPYRMSYVVELLRY